ncbi:hypothetical protein DLM75_18050 [Leptospira stimsonii]|uniref:Uncharacterized protein n=1 Tax=Leptospira stimsonii TaxID=2202203 RepID=A0A396YZV1_9LEPT|nr:hypothetical protein DLM75_18050 [Leptospira stimsonii]
MGNVGTLTFPEIDELKSRRSLYKTMLELLRSRNARPLMGKVGTHTFSENRDKNLEGCFIKQCWNSLARGKFVR